MLLFGGHGEALKVLSNGARGDRVGELLALQWKGIDWDAKTITFSKGFWRGRLQESTKTGQDHVRHISKTLARVLAEHFQISKNIGPDDFVFCRSDEDARPHDQIELGREVLFPSLHLFDAVQFPRIRSGKNIVEAFPNAFLVVLLAAEGLMTCRR